MAAENSTPHHQAESQGLHTAEADPAGLTPHHVVEVAAAAGLPSRYLRRRLVVRWPMQLERPDLLAQGHIMAQPALPASSSLNTDTVSR